MDDILELIRRFQVQQPGQTPGTVPDGYEWQGPIQQPQTPQVAPVSGLMSDSLMGARRTPSLQVGKNPWVTPPSPPEPEVSPERVDAALPLSRILNPRPTEQPQPQQPAQFPGPAFKAIGSDNGTPQQPDTTAVAKAVNGQQSLTASNDQEYRARLAKIMQADRLARAVQAGEGGMSDALKLILTTGSHIRSGAPPVPQLRGDSAGEAMAGHTAMQMRALEGEENRDVRKSQIESNNEYRNFLQEQRLRSQERSDMLAGRLPPKGQDQIIFADNAIAAINRIRASLPKIESGIGPIEGRIHRILVDVGIADPNMAITNANLVELMARQVQSISGVAVSNQEFNRLRQAGPNIAQDPAQFKALLDNFEEIVRTRKNQVLDMYGKMGFNVDPLREGMAGKSSEGDRIRFRHADGRIGNIKASQWEGYKAENPDAQQI
jgi:hypothetical protein